MPIWHDRIDRTTELDDLVFLVRDYLATWGAEDLALIPEQARPLRVKGVDDLAFWHQRLVDCYITGTVVGESNERVREMLHFFAFAVQRAEELDGMPPVDEHEAAARLFSDRSVPTLFTSALTGAAER